MKKLLILLPIILTLLLAACAPQIVREGGVVERGSDEPDTISRDGVSTSSSEAQSYDEEDIVYATKTGTKYHKAGCSHLSNSKIPISLEQAKQQGLAPCSVCDPPT